MLCIQVADLLKISVKQIMSGLSLSMIDSSSTCLFELRCPHLNKLWLKLLSQSQLKIGDIGSCGGLVIFQSISVVLSKLAPYMESSCEELFMISSTDVPLLWGLGL